LPVYFGVNGEYATLVRNITKDDVKTTDQGLTRFDVSPSLRIPFTKLQFFTVNSSIAWRGHVLDRKAWTSRTASSQVEQGIGRTYMDFTSRMTGPVFNRIFNRPSRKFKHVVEPTMTIQHITAIDNFDRIVRLEGSDSIVGGSTRFNYGVSNRLYAKKETSREVLSATISQNYYTDAKAAQYDQFVQSGYGAVTPTKFGPVVLQVRGRPDRSDPGIVPDRMGLDDARDTQHLGGGSFNTREWLHTTVNGPSGATFRRCPPSATRTRPTTI
jgi:hypothetical protein